MAYNNLSLQAYQLLRSKILCCEFAPGTLLNESILGELIPGSRTPIREALGRLEQEGLVTIIPKKGIQVVPISLPDIMKVYATRLIIEPYVVKHYANNIAEDTYLNLYKTFIQKNTNIDPAPYYEQDDFFHRTFITASNNLFFIQTYEQLAAQNHRARYVISAVSTAHFPSAHNEHLDILLACMKKDWDSAASLMEKHLQLSRQLFIERLSSI